MGKRGPQPLPTKILELRGSTLLPKRLASGEPKPAPGVPAVPAWVSPAAAAHWPEIVKILEPYGVLTIQDGGALGLLVEAVAHYETAKATLEKAKGRSKLSWTRLMNASWDRVLKAFREFGLTPSSRSGVKAGGGEEKDPLAAFVAKKQG